MTTKVQPKKSSRNSGKPYVIRSFFAVLPVGTDVQEMSVVLAAKSKALAIRLYEHWNDGNIKLDSKTMKATGLCVKKLVAKNAV